MNTASVDLARSVFDGTPAATERRYLRRQANFGPVAGPSVSNQEPSGWGTDAVSAPVAGDVFAALSEEKRLMARINDLAQLTTIADWDGERGECVLPGQWDAVRRLVSRYSSESAGIPSPFISACGDGSAHLQWTTPRGDRGVIEIGRSTTTWSFVPMADGVEDVIVELKTPDDGLEKVRALFGRA